jgi:predicted transcriptional regulator
MKKDIVRVPASKTLKEFVEDYVYEYHHKLYPVVDSGQTTACINVVQVKEVPREEWNQRTVGQLATRCDKNNSIKADTDAVKALTQMNRSGHSRLMVMSDDKLVGIITLRDLMQFLSLKIDLESA